MTVEHPVVREELLKSMCHPEVFKRLPKGGVRRMKVTYARYRDLIKVGKQIKGIVSARGGVTTVSLNIYGQEFIASAVCSAQENFCKKTGREMAFLRVVEKYWETLQGR